MADVLAGGRFLFRNTFAIGEKVELIVGATTVEGTVKEVNVTNTMVRSPNGELFVVPNGDISVIRNFSRAPFSSTKIRFYRSFRQADGNPGCARTVGGGSAGLLPDLTKPWQVISTAETLGAKAEVTVIAHTSLPKRPRCGCKSSGLINQRLTEAGIELLD